MKSYREFTESKQGFSINRLSRLSGVALYSWDTLLGEMIHNNLISIWRKVEVSELRAKFLYKYPTPFLKTLSPRVPTPGR